MCETNTTQEKVSPAEADLLAALWFYELHPELQHEFTLDLRGWSIYADFFFPDDRLVVEVDGREWHNISRDVKRDNRLRTQRVRILRIAASDVWRDPLQSARWVRGTLAWIRRVKAS